MTQSAVVLVGFAAAVVGAVLCGIGMLRGMDRLASIGFGMFCAGAFCVVASIPFLPSA